MSSVLGSLMSSAPKSVADAEYKNEFHQFWNEFPNDIGNLTEKYPLTMLISSVAFFFFGFMNVFSFSPTNIITGSFLLLLSASTALSIYRNSDNLMSFVTKVLASIKDVAASLNATKSKNTENAG